MTIDDLAASIQKEFVAIRKDMATKSELALLRGEIAGMRETMDGMRETMATKKDLADLREEISTRFATRSELQSAVSAAKNEILEEIGKIKYAKEIDELRVRVQRVEQKLGIGPGRRAA